MLRVLVVDDDEHQRLLCREELEEDGYEVTEAEDGRQALRRIDERPPDAVVLDINMPGMDGLHTLTCIHDRHRRLPVVLNSAYSAYKSQFVSWIADAYVTKSSNLGALRAAVRDVLMARGGEGQSTSIPPAR
jgi:two-component system response regulator (stage 0 sporulation protein F)